ncbi:uncharacterized protein [Bombus flavifrons]|uniref:uncharacterized protein isoform X1 n=1 Tax=Bombus flavifrons TaxID=103934 RepID=UPI003704C8C5
MLSLTRMDISNMLEVQVDEVKEVDIKENVTPKELLPSTTNAPVPISQEEYNYYKLMFGNDISIVQFQRLHCTACDAHIGSAPADAHNMFEHPVLHTLLCAKCKDFYGDGTFEQGDDDTDMFCRWCANGGNLYCCSFCSNTFCYKCIKRNFDPILRKKIEAVERWKCFVCDPTDLYNARGTCWALLQHIQTINRIYQNCKLPQEEIDDKMNTDESKCCPRRRKRKRRRNGSNSEEEDETYMPKQIVPNAVPKRKKKGRGKTKFSNCNSISMSDKYIGISDDTSTDNNRILPSLLSCEQTMVECENTTIGADGTIISQSQVNPGHHRMNLPIAQQPTMYNTAVMNVVTNSNFLQSSSPIVPRRHVSTSLNQTNQVNLYQTLHSTPTSMVTIPNQNINLIHRPRFFLPKPQAPRTNTNFNIIEIESDSEDVAVVGPSGVPRPTSSSNSNDKAVPVALLSSSSKNNYTITVKQDVQKRHNAKTLNQRLLPHGKEINSILLHLKMKFQDLFDTAKREEFKNYEPTDARLLIKQFHSDIRDTVTQLAYINDRIIREYNRWRKYSTKMGRTQSIDKNNIRKTSRGKRDEIPLDMTCVNESDEDSNINDEIEYGIMGPSDLVGNTNVVDGINFFKKRSTIERAVGNHSVLLVDKSVQINSAELENYDRSILYFALTKSNKQSGKKNNVSISPVKKGNKQSGSYEDHFIQFLQKQSVNSQSKQAENSEELPDPNETSLKDLIEANSPYVSEMLETMDKSTASSSNISSISVKKESDLKFCESRQGNSITCRVVDDFSKMVSNINDDLVKKTAANEFIDNNSRKEAKTQKGHFSITGEVDIVNVTKNKGQHLSITSTIESEDDCTIIDD